MSYRSLYWFIGILLVAQGAIWAALGIYWTPPAPIRPNIPDVAELDVPRSTGSNGEGAERPVFWPSRRAVAADAPAVAEDTNDLNGATVVGLLYQDGHPVIIVNQENKARRIVAGQDFGGWKFTGIEDGAAIFQRGASEKKQLRISRFRVADLPKRSETSMNAAAAAAGKPPAVGKASAPAGRAAPAAAGARPQPAARGAAKTPARQAVPGQRGQAQQQGRAPAQQRPQDATGAKSDASTTSRTDVNN